LNKELVSAKFKIVSIATLVLPVCLSPIINSRCPLPIGTRLSIALIPVNNGTLTGIRSIIPVAFFSILLTVSN